MDFASDAIHIAEICRGQKEPVLRFAAGIDIVQKQSDPSQVAAELKRLTTGVAGGKKTVIAAEASGVAIRSALYPVMSMKELRRAIAWDITSLVPYEQGTYYYDFAVAGNQIPGLKVLVVAVRKESVDARIRILRQAGLTPAAVDIEPLAVYRTLNMPGNLLIMAIGSCSSWIAIFEKHVPVIYRHIAHQQGFCRSSSMPDLYEAVLLPEIHRTLESYHTLSPGTPISLVCLEKQPDPVSFAAFMANKTGMTAKRHDSLHGLHINRKIPPVNNLSSLDIAVGLALYDGE
ncbi:type IV pilus biogenesis protein PilM [Acetonema longum]|uniref:type IV pilus biogenesis protein PilM n=1 Tax=Acetonema longum TaxID=2374 RepID=UPI00058C3ACD|nr:pilus assembly protein PilM [Acetonema longum]